MLMRMQSFWSDSRRARARPITIQLMAAVLLLASLCPAQAGNLVGRVTSRGRPIRDAVLFVDDLRAPPVHERKMMDQRDRTFIPHVMAVQLGTRVDFPNHDTVYH